jgi:hypothetical protein
MDAFPTVVLAPSDLAWLDGDSRPPGRVIETFASGAQGRGMLCALGLTDVQIIHVLRRATP